MIMIQVESFEDPYYQTTNWDESDNYWYVDASIGSEVPLEDFNWVINLTTAQSYNDTSSFYSYDDLNGNHSVELFMDGRHDDGVVWLEKKFQVREMTEKIHLSGHIFSEFESAVNNWAVLIYIGLQNPETETDLRGINDEGIIGRTEEVAGWQSYSRSVSMTVPAHTIVYLAFGISITSEYNRTYYIDALMYNWVPVPLEVRMFLGFLFYYILPFSLIVMVLVLIIVVFLLIRRKKRNLER